MVGAGAALIGTCYGLARFAYGLFAPEFEAEFAISSAVSGVIGSGSYVGYCAAITGSFILTPRWGARRMAVLAGVVATLGIATVAVAPSAPVLAAGILVAGSSTGIASPPMAAAVATWCPPASPGPGADHRQCRHGFRCPGLRPDRPGPPWKLAMGMGCLRGHRRERDPLGRVRGSSPTRGPFTC